MKPYIVLCSLFFAGCATVPSEMRDDGSGGTVASGTQEVAEPVRLETRAGTFLVRPSNAADFEKLLAGEPTQQRYTAGILLAGD